MSIYPDWIGETSGSGETVVVGSYSVDITDTSYTVGTESAMVVEMDKEGFDVNYG